MDILERFIELRRQGARAALVTVVHTRGSTPRKAGARMILHAGGRGEGTVGGGTVEHVVREAAAAAIASGAAALLEYKLTTELAMCCGGQMTFFVEPIVQTPTLIVFGCGHVGSAVIWAAGNLGFEIIAVDDLDDNTDPARLPQANRIIRSYERDELSDLPFGPDTYVLIATREHNLDQKLLELCIEKPWRYLGVIGSSRKARMQRERLAAKDIPADRIERVRCPVGLDIGAQTPEEIAIAVCAELVATRRDGEGVGGAKAAER